MPYSTYYGTLRTDSSAFREFELLTYLSMKQEYQAVALARMTIAAIFWPVAWIAALVLALFCNRTARQKRAIIVCLLTSLSGIAWCGIPSICLYKVGHVKLKELLMAHQISIWEVIGTYLDHIFFVLSMMIANKVYHYRLNTHIVLKALRDVFEHRRDELGMLVSVELEEIQRVLPDLEKCLTPMPYDEERHHISVTAILEILERLPGWNSKYVIAPPVDYQEKFYGESRVFCSTLHEMRSENGLLPIEQMVSSYPDFDEEPNNLFQRCVIVMCGVWSTFAESFRTTNESSRTLLCVLIALLRAIIPRLWIKYYFNGPLFPQGTIAQILTCASFISTFVAATCILVLFMAAESRYAGHREKLLLVSALVDPVLRLRCAGMLRKYEENNDDLQNGQLLAKIPLLQLTRADNTRAFARLREYAEVTRIHERQCVREMISVVLLLTLFSTILSLSERFFNKAFLSVGLALDLFDYLVACVLVTKVLQDALEINSIRQRHVQVIHDCRYRATMRLIDAAAREGPDPTQSQALFNDPTASSSRKQLLKMETMAEAAPISKSTDSGAFGRGDIALATRLQTHMIHHFEANDVLDHPLFGMELTPAAFVGVLLSMVVGFCTIVGTALSIGPKHIG